MPSATVVDESDEDELPESEVVDPSDGDVLADLPDDTEVRVHRSCANIAPVLTRRVQEIDLVHARLATLDQLRLPRFSAHLKRLCLRQNFIAHLDPAIFHTLTKLEDLDLYDNKLKTAGEALDLLPHLRLACICLTNVYLGTHRLCAVFSISRSTTSELCRMRSSGWCRS